MPHSSLKYACNSNKYIVLKNKKFVLVYDMSQMHALMEKAMKYIQGVKLDEIQYLVRCKSFQYYINVQIEGNGIEKPYLKDEAGDEKCPINGNENELTQTPEFLSFGSCRFRIMILLTKYYQNNNN